MPRDNVRPLRPFIALADDGLVHGYQESMMRAHCGAGPALGGTTAEDTVCEQCLDVVFRVFADGLTDNDILNRRSKKRRHARKEP